MLGTFAAGAEAGSNPANAPKLLNQPIEDYRYDYADGCRRKVTGGIARLRRWIDRRYLGEFWGALDCRRIRKSRRWSLHAEGRALDWRLDAARWRERRAARRLIRLLLATDKRGNEHALARRMGVQEIIFNCRSWSSGPGGMERYDPCDARKVDRTTAHRDHVHIGLSWPGAKLRTSFWRSGLASG